jgi:hypothetical protein
MSNNQTYITVNELAERLHYNPRYINQSLKDSVLFEGKHYIRPFGGRKVLYIWEAIEEEMSRYSRIANAGIPMSNGGHCYG